MHQPQPTEADGRRQLRVDSRETFPPNLQGRIGTYHSLYLDRRCYGTTKLETLSSSGNHLLHLCSPLHSQTLFVLC